MLTTATFDKMNASRNFIYYDEKFFVAKLWKTILPDGVLELFKNDKSLTEAERVYFEKEYGQFL